MASAGGAGVAVQALRWHLAGFEPKVIGAMLKGTKTGKERRSSAEIHVVGFA